LVRRIWISIMVTAMFAVVGTGAQARAPAHSAKPRFQVVGTASWYGWHQHGRRMADGKPFHALGSAAASSSLPLGSRVKVTNLANHRVAWVTIEDRNRAGRGPRG
jgi:rare lipoprotein A (peptidoglycan hydrolase)